VDRAVVQPGDERLEQGRDGCDQAGPVVIMATFAGYIVHGALVAGHASSPA